MQSGPEDVPRTSHQPAAGPPTEAAPDGLARMLRWLLGAVLVAVLVFSALALASDLGELTRSLNSLHPSSFVAALVLATGNYALRFVRWQRYLATLERRVSLGMSALVFLSGFAMSVTPGKIGELFKAILLRRVNGTPIEQSGPIVIAERLTDVLGLVLLIALGALVFPQGLWLALAGLSVVALALAACAIPTVGYALLNVLEHAPLIRGIAPKLRTAYDTLRHLLRPAPLFEATAISVAAWFLEVLALHALLWGVNVDLSVLISTFVYSASTMAGALAMMPGGLLVTEAGMTGLLVTLGDGQVSTADASAVTILVRLATLWWAVGLGFVSLLVFRRATRR